jgi:hypothetical protein
MYIIIEYTNIEDCETYRHFGPFETVDAAMTFGRNFGGIGGKWFWQNLLPPIIPQD